MQTLESMEKVRFIQNPDYSMSGFQDYTAYKVTIYAG